MIIDNFYIDDNIKFIEPSIDAGCFIAYDSGDFNGTRAMVVGVNDLGDVADNWDGGIRLSTVESDQFIKGLVKLSTGYFVIWKDQRSGSSDIYGQMVDYNGILLGPSDGLAITAAINRTSPLAASSLKNHLNGAVM